jgi:hypothetical protein
VRRSRGLLPNKRMQLTGASGVGNVGLCAVEKSPQLMRGPLGSAKGESVIVEARSETCQ